jgi:type II secretory pathway predicted ATPase ExeA
MYQSHWGLEEPPFRTRLDPRGFYQSPTHEEALARLHFLVDRRRRLGLLLGPLGSGKSLLLEVFAEEMRRLGQPAAKLNLLGLDEIEMLGLLAGQFHLSPGRGFGVGSLWRLLTDRIVEYRYQRLDAVVLLDDADEASHQVLTQVARLARLDRPPDARLTIVLAGRPEKIGRLGECLLELAELRIDVEPWEPADTARYLEAAVARAGRDDPLFAEPAIERLHELSQGIPRRISQLADLALLAGADRKLQQVDADTVESVYHELGVIEVEG